MVGTDLTVQYEFKRQLFKAKMMLEAGEKENEILKLYEEDDSFSLT